MSIPLDPRVKELAQLPHTISFVIRKRQQIDNLNELPKEKRPTDELIWEGTAEELDEWLDKVMGPSNKKGGDGIEFVINDNNIEG